MNKSQLVAAVRAAHLANFGDIPRTHCESIVSSVFTTITETLEAGGQVGITDFGSFKVKEVAGRSGRNPHSGATLEIPPKKKVSFRPGTGLKNSVQ